MVSRETLYYGIAGYDWISLVYPFHPLVLDSNLRVSVIVELAIFCLLGGGERQRQITRTKGESHLRTLVSRKVVALASEVRADDRNENDMFVQDEENG
jgi:hypothetical protein